MMLAAIAGLTCAQRPRTVTVPDMPSDDRTSRDEHEIRAIEATYDAAWARADAGALVAAFVDDAVVINPRGQVANGRAEFETVMTGMLAGPFAGSTHETTVERIRFVSQDVAVVDGIARITGVHGEPSPIRHPFTDIFVRRDGRWMITDVRAYTFLPLL